MRHVAPLLAAVLALATASVVRAQEEPVMAFQQFLADRGCSVGTADGDWGARTTAAAANFSAASGIAIERPVTADLIASLQATSSECEVPSIAERLIPADVLAAAKTSPDLVALCRPSRAETAIKRLQLTEPPEALEGLQSSMSNSYDIAEYRLLDKVSAGFSHLATSVLAVDGEQDQFKRDAVIALARWAEAGAFLKTKDCTNNRCPDVWQSKRGVELSPEKDSDSVLERVYPMALGYYSALADYDRAGLAAEHGAIDSWFQSFSKRLRNKSPKGEVFLGFGMGWGWANITFDLVAGRADRVAGRLATLDKGMRRLMLKDGSIKDRTTRGSRATWYHFSSLNEFFVSFEMLRANGIDVYPDYEDRLHKSVEIFLNAFDDPASIYPWAKADYRSAGDPREQDFPANDFYYADMGSSWPAIYMLRYPGHPNTGRLTKMMDSISGAHLEDMAVGISMSCIYAAAARSAAAAGLANAVN
jgi:hypothetical protein